MKLNLFLLSAAAMVNAATATATVDAVDLGTAGDYAILAKTGISTVPYSVITGDIAVSPIAAGAITGFSLVSALDGKGSTSTQVTGHAYAANYIAPTPTILTTAVSDMETAYTDAAARANTNGKNLKGGLIGGETLTPGVYTFGTDITIDADLTLDGAGVYIIQTTGDVKLAAGTKVTLLDGDNDKATADKIFWQVAGTVTVGAVAQMEGVLLTKTATTFETGSTLNGRILTQTAAVLQSATITAPTSA
jgi:hypothetical protein